MEHRNCQNCKNDFIIEAEDFAFYDKIHVPAPTFCPECMLQRRMMFRNERTLYKRQNNAPSKIGENIVSIHRPETGYTVYDDKTWWGDSWDPIDHGSGYDFSKPFFEQFHELYKNIPLINLSVTNMVNCEYCNVAEGDKGCFMTTASNNNEDCLYGNRLSNNTNCVDSYILTKVNSSYETINCSNSYKIYYSNNSVECSDSYFLFDCQNCIDCIGCINLKNKSYCILNQQYSREEYKEIKNKLNLNSHSGIQEFSKIFDDFKLKNFHKYSNVFKCVNSTGDNIENSKNVINGYDIYDAEDCKNVTWGGYGMRDSYCSGPGVGIQSELIYDSFDTALGVSQCYFTSVAYHSLDIQYSINCHNSSHLFGCIGLRKKEYCILNKQYTKSEYEELLPKIKQHMMDMPYVDKLGRIFTYGEFFPYDISPFSYNETVAQEYYPLSKDEAIKNGFSWYDRESRNYNIDIKQEDIPDTIDQVDESILNQIIECAGNNNEKTGCTGAFKIVLRELEFYKMNNLPLPHYCPNCRHFNRLKQRNPMKLWHRKCMCDKQNHNHDGVCPNEFETSYVPERPEIIYCEKCYQQEVI